MSHKKSIILAATLLSALTLTSCGNGDVYLTAYNKYLSRTASTAGIANIESKVVKCSVFSVDAEILTPKIDEKTGEPVIDEKTGDPVYVSKSIAANYYYRLEFDGSVRPYKGVDVDVYYLTYESDTGAMSATPKTDDFTVAYDLFNDGTHKTFSTAIKGDLDFSH